MARGFTTRKRTTDSKFARVEKPVDIRRIMVRAKSELANAIVWTKGRQILLKSKISEDMNPKEEIIIALKDNPPKNIQKLIEKTGSKMCHVMLTIGKHSVVGFKAKFIKSTSSGHHFFLPDMVMRAQRRADYRYVITKGRPVDVIHSNPKSLREKLRSSLIDISVRGLSFLVPFQEGMSYKRGMLMRHVHLRMHGQSILLDAEVRNSFKQKNGVKVGVQFRRLRKEDSDWLAGFITRHAIQYWG